MTFKDYFSRQAVDYASYRPDYPEALFMFLAESAVERELAWDCATGNGQAARGLAGYFDRVIATDPSEAQIQNAAPHDKIDYFIAPAEQSGIPSCSVDLITVAQALHWFQFDAFYAEARRVLKPGGLLAAWCYGLGRINPDVDKVVQHYYKNIVGDHWPPERRYIDDKYQTIPFAFAELPTPDFYMKAEWRLSDLTGYLNTWSATQRYQQQNQQNPINIVHRLLAKAWGPEDTQRTVRWPLYLRLGRKTA